MFTQAWHSILRFLTSLAWFASGPVCASFLISIGSWLYTLKGFSAWAAISLSLVLAAVYGTLVLRSASLMRTAAHFLLTASYMPLYYLTLWGLSFLAPLLSGTSVPNQDIFLHFANPLRPLNLAMIVMAITFILSRIISQKSRKR